MWRDGDSPRWNVWWHVIDLHSHILPGVDDGPRTVEESAAIVRLLAGLGFDHFVLTPHFRPGFFDCASGRLDDALEALRASLGGDPARVDFTVANEVHLDSVFDARGRMQGFLTFGANPRHVLLEMPRQAFPFELLWRTIDRLLGEGVRAVLAHPERHPALFHEPETRARIRERGTLLQVNLTSLAGLDGPMVRRTAATLCRLDMVDAFGTDAHGLAQTTEFVPRGLRKAEKLLGESRMRKVTEASEIRAGFPVAR